jgi:hypothetical protein
MQVPEFAYLRLVGGTALALQIGHRTSVDIDLFGKMPTDSIDLAYALNKIGEISAIKKSPNIFIQLINGIKVDLVNYPYPWVDDEVREGVLRLACKKDIAAMKLSAITGRGSKKDFIDLYFLLKEFSLKEMIQFYNQKYHDGSEFLVLKSVTYFGDAEKDEMPKMFEKVFWSEIKKYIIKSVDAYLEL